MKAFILFTGISVRGSRFESENLKSPENFHSFIVLTATSITTLLTCSE